MFSEYKNFDEFLSAQALMFRDKPCLTDGESGRIYSYRELNDTVDRVAAYLALLGIRKGRRFATLTRNCPEFIFLYLASMKLGSLIVPLAVDLPTAGLIKALYTFDAHLVFFSDEVRQCVQEAKKERPEILAETIPIRSLLIASTNTKPDTLLYAPVSFNDAGSLYGSSGTTGEPKGIPQSPRNVLSAASALVDVYGFDATDTQAGMLPCYHTAMATYGFWPSIVAGSNFVLYERFSKSMFWKRLADTRASFVEVVPTILTMLLNPPEDTRTYDLSRLRFIGSGSAPLPVPLKQRFENTFGVLVANQYGLSEAAPTHFNPPLKEKRKEGSIGFALPSVEAKVVDENGADVPDGETGEIVMRGPSIVKEYDRNESATKDAFRKGWFYTGDLAHKDADGFYFLMGRRKEMISRGGQKMYPNEIDTVLLSLTDDVRESATIGIPDPVYGEEVVSYVVPASKKNGLKERILAHCARELPPYKCPKEIYFVDEIPQTASGKIFRRKLQERFEREHGTTITTPNRSMFPALQAFYRRMYRSNYPLANERFLSWWLHDNPFFKEDGYSCKVALRDNAIVGHFAYVPLPMWGGGAVHRGAWTANLIVDESERGKGIGGKLIDAVMGEFDIVADVGAVPSAEQLLHRKSWTNFGTLYRAVGILDEKRARAFAPKRFPIETCLIHLPATHISETTVSETSRFGDRVDFFWETFRKHIGVGTDRSSAFLNWRYADHPIFSYTLFEARDGDTVTGIAVVRLEDVSGSDTRVLRIMECIGEDTAMQALVSAIAGFGEAHGACLIDFFCSSKKYLAAFLKHSFSMSPEADSFARRFQPVDFAWSTVSFNGANHRGVIAPATFNDREEWYATSGDGDQDRPNKI